jgi:hypothetical protein
MASLKRTHGYIYTSYSSCNVLTDYRLYNVLEYSGKVRVVYIICLLDVGSYGYWYLGTGC